jgi:hypothetical protein
VLACHLHIQRVGSPVPQTNFLSAIGSLHTHHSPCMPLSSISSDGAISSLSTHLPPCMAQVGDLVGRPSLGRLLPWAPSPLATSPPTYRNNMPPASTMVCHTAQWLRCVRPARPCVPFALISSPKLNNKTQLFHLLEARDNKPQKRNQTPQSKNTQRPTLHNDTEVDLLIYLDTCHMSHLSAVSRVLLLPAFDGESTVTTPEDGGGRAYLLTRTMDGASLEETECTRPPYYRQPLLSTRGPER